MESLGVIYEEEVYLDYLLAHSLLSPLLGNPSARYKIYKKEHFPSNILFWFCLGYVPVPGALFLDVGDGLLFHPFFSRRCNGIIDLNINIYE